MIRRYCDMCDAEITVNAVSDRIRGHHSVWTNGENRRINVEVMAGFGMSVNGGDLCAGCVIDAVKSLDKRPRDGKR